MEVYTRWGVQTEKWPGLPIDIDAAIRLNDGFLYFVKGSL